MHEDVSVEVRDHVARVAFGSGERLNALGMDEWEALGRAARELAADDSVRAVVVRGRGGAFCAGSNLREWENADADEVTRRFWRIEQTIRAVEDLPMPTVAIIEGVAAGGGCQLALACDLQLTAASARIGMPVSRLGILVPPSFATRLSLRIGPSRTKDLLYGGRMLSAAEAHDVGLVTTLVPDGELDSALAGLLGIWAGISQGSLRAAKAAVDRGLEPLTERVRREPPGPVADPEEFQQRINGFLRDRP
jgi:enoyl-CoA hydratase/carnithine racemase